jgi:hypothetical protein
MMERPMTSILSWAQSANDQFVFHPSIKKVAGVPEKCRHRSCEPDKPFSSIDIQVSVGRDFLSPFLFKEVMPPPLFVIFGPPLVFVFKTPEMMVLMHGSPSLRQ